MILCIQIHKVFLFSTSREIFYFMCNVCLCVCLLRMGCGALDYRQQAQQMELRTGGMSVSTQVIPDSAELDMYEQVRASTVSLCLKPLTEASASFLCAVCTLINQKMS